MFSKKILAVLQEALLGVPDTQYPHNKPIKLCIEEAIKAIKEGNFGVGAVIVNKHTGEVMVSGHNQVFYPTFKSDAHAEMVVLEAFEKLGEMDDLDDLVLFTSLEPCAMWLPRILVSKLRTVYYAADDSTGGMVHLSEHLPETFTRLLNGKTLEKAVCSLELMVLAGKVFHEFDETYRLFER
ncbi:nucleoside deaminase [Thermoproteota archaeon]